MQQLHPQIGENFPSPIPAGTKAGDHYLHFTTTFFDVSYYTQTPRKHATLVNQGEFKVYFADINDIPFIRIQTPLGELYFTLNILQMEGGDLIVWKNKRRFTTNRLTFYLLNMKNVIIASRSIVIIGHRFICETAESALENYDSPEEFEKAAELTISTYSSSSFREQFMLIG